MISRLQIANYKSVESLEIETRRVNVFIGEPNSGKSNLLEALAMFSPGGLENIKEISRCQHAAELFFDNDISREIVVIADDLKFRILPPDVNPDAVKTDLYHWKFWHLGNNSHNAGTIFANLSKGLPPKLLSRQFLYYRFLPHHQTTPNDAIQNGSLEPPYGRNLPATISSNKPLRDSVAALFRTMGYRLELRPQESEILMLKEVDDVLFSYRFSSISETLRRLVFYKAVLETNKNSILILDELEANTFPFYIKYLAERIALDETNQFFLTTHNPYVLMSIIEKTPLKDLAVYVTRMVNYRTEVRRLKDAELDGALDLGMDIFFNLDRYFPE